MKKFLQQLWEIRHLLLNTVFAILVTLLLVHVYDLLHYKYIAIEFEDLRPMREKIDIFYKGINIGHVRKMNLCRSCKMTRVECVLTYKNLLLPINTTALMKKEKKKDKEYDFIELQYPEDPSTTLIGNGTVLNGKTTMDVVQYMNNQRTNDLDEIKNNLVETTQDLVIVLSAMGEVFTTMNELLKQNQKNIYKTTSNFSNTSDNLKNLTEKIDLSVKQEQLNESISNLTTTTDNLKTVTSTLSGTGTSVNEAMLPQVQSTLYRTECLVANTNELVCGIKETLQKRFGAFRLMFGRPISSKNVKNKDCNCCN